jgi:hypothetical protein
MMRVSTGAPLWGLRAAAPFMGMKLSLWQIDHTRPAWKPG